MTVILWMILTKLIFVLLLLAFKCKTFTFHLCLAKPIYWKFGVEFAKLGEVDEMHTLALGPINFAVIR